MDAVLLETFSDHNELLLAGYKPSRSDYVVARWSPVDNQFRKTVTYALEDFFSSELIKRHLDYEDDCGADIFEVASIRLVDDQSMAVLALGGDGERIGAHQSASAVAMLDTKTLSVNHFCVVDEHDGASGLLLAPDGAIILNCCSSVHVVRFDGPAE